MHIFYIQEASKEIKERIHATGNWEVDPKECQLPTELDSFPVCAESAGKAFHQFAKEAEEVVVTTEASSWSFQSGIYHIWKEGSCAEDFELVTTAELVRQNLFQVYIGTDERIWKS